jgi:hypothetical protein
MTPRRYLTLLAAILVTAGQTLVFATNTAASATASLASATTQAPDGAGRA